MSVPTYYYKYEFVSPEPLYAKIKMEFNSYFDSGVVNDTLFPTWTEDILGEFRNSPLKIQEAIMCIDDYYAILPPDYKRVREAWAINTPMDEVSWRNPSSCYSTITTKISDTNTDFKCNPLPCSDCDPCINADVIQIFYKTNKVETFTSFRKSHLLKPGNISTIDECAKESPNLSCQNNDTFDIHGNRFTTQYRQGEVYLVYYALPLTEQGYQMLPDNQFIKNVVEAYIKYKTAEAVWNMSSDESFAQSERKMLSYQQAYFEKKAIAETEFKKQTIEQKRLSLKRTKQSLNRYNIR